MFVWISAGAALLLWGLLVYFFGGQFLLSGRKMESERIEKEVDKMFETRESTAKALADTPGDPLYGYRWILFSVEDHDWAETVVRSRRFVSRFPRLRPGYLWLARGLWQTGDIAGSRKVLRQMRRRYGPDGSVFEIIFHQELERGDLKAAARVARKLRRTYPDALVGYRMEVRALLALGETAAAEKVILLADREWPENDEVAVLWDDLEAALAGPDAAPLAAAATEAGAT